MESNIQSGIAFSGNPIFLTYDGEPDGGLRGVPFLLTMGDGAYSGRFTASFDLNVARILDSMTWPVEEVTEDMAWIGPVAVVENTLSLIRRRADFHVGTSLNDWSCIILPGGVSADELRACGGDPFASRFCDYSGNFFLTGRSSGWVIPMGERELSPLYFYKAVSLTGLAIVDPMTNSRIEVDFPSATGIYALDVAKARRMIFDRYGALASVLDIYANGSPEVSCRIVVEKASRNDGYRVAFRSSLGVMELMDLGAIATVGHELSEECEYKAYEKLTDDFFIARDRIPVTTTMEVVARPCHPDRARRILDMAASDLVYVIADDGSRLRVVPSLGESQYPVKGEAVSMSIRFRLANDECRQLPDVGNIGRPRIHSDEFDVEFN